MIENLKIENSTKMRVCATSPYERRYDGQIVTVLENLLVYILKEKLPQAFMQIGWMEDDFRNLIAKVWTNLDNPIKTYDFSTVSLILCMSPSQVALF